MSYQELFRDLNQKVASKLEYVAKLAADAPKESPADSYASHLAQNPEMVRAVQELRAKHPDAGNPAGAAIWGAAEKQLPPKADVPDLQLSGRDRGSEYALSAKDNMERGRSELQKVPAPQREARRPEPAPKKESPKESPKQESKTPTGPRKTSPSPDAGLAMGRPPLPQPKAKMDASRVGTYDLPAPTAAIGDGLKESPTPTPEVPAKLEEKRPPLGPNALTQLNSRETPVSWEGAGNWLSSAINKINPFAEGVVPRTAEGDAFGTAFLNNLADAGGMLGNVASRMGQGASNAVDTLGNIPTRIGRGATNLARKIPFIGDMIPKPGEPPIDSITNSPVETNLRGADAMLAKVKAEMRDRALSAGKKYRNPIEGDPIPRDMTPQGPDVLNRDILGENTNFNLPIEQHRENLRFLDQALASGTFPPGTEVASDDERRSYIRGLQEMRRNTATRLESLLGAPQPPVRVKSAPGFLERFIGYDPWKSDQPETPLPSLKQLILSEPFDTNPADYVERFLRPVYSPITRGIGDVADSVTNMLHPGVQGYSYPLLRKMYRGAPDSRNPSKEEISRIKSSPIVPGDF